MYDLSKGALWPLFELTGNKVKKEMRVRALFHSNYYIPPEERRPTLFHILQVIEPLVKRIISEARNRLAADSTKHNNKAKEHEFLVDYLVSITPDDKIVRDELLNLLLAGTRVPIDCSPACLAGQFPCNEDRIV
jgi:hypothetical protein